MLPRLEQPITISDYILQRSRLSAQLTRSCMSSGRRCLTCDATNPFLKAFCSSCTLSFRCFCELEHACSAQWWIHVITYVCTKVLLTLTLKISDCLSLALNQDPQALSHAQANLGIGAPYCSSYHWEWAAGLGRSCSLAVTTAGAWLCAGTAGSRAAQRCKSADHSCVW